ncbi:MAG: DUF1836 domain-containing protein [Eubacteriales bacterium]
MSIEKDKVLASIINALDEFDYMKVDEIPDIDLYMDQVTTLMEQKLKTTARYPGEDKILTKTMINNYAKNRLLPPPEKKKYSKDHILILTFIYYYKGFLSISDIQALIKPLTEQFFDVKEGVDLSTIYGEILEAQKIQAEGMKKDIEQKLSLASEMFTELPDEQAEFLQLFSFISLIGFDVYFKKLMIERFTDIYLKEEENKDKGEV